MAFGGNMNTVLRNNEKQKLNRGTTLRKGTVGSKAHQGYSFDDKKASPEQLKDIRDRIQKRRKKQWMQYILFVPLISYVLYSLFKLLF